MDKELGEQTIVLSETFDQSVAAGQLGIFDAAVQASGVSDQTIAKALSGQLVSAVGGAAGAGICAALGAAALSPACAAAGAWAAEKLAVVVKDIADSLAGIFNAKGAGEPGDEGYAVFTPDWKALDAKRNAILKALSLSGDDPITVDAIKRLAYQMCPTEVMLKALGPLAMTQPMGAGYASFLVVPPFYVAPQAFEPYPQGNTKNVIAFTYNGALAWDDSIIRGLVEPLIKGGLPLKWAFGELISKHLGKHTGHPANEYFIIRDAVANEVVKEIDKWVEARLKWILEESAMRRNVKATKALSLIDKRLRVLHPEWSKDKVAKAKENIVRAVKSNDEPTLLTELEHLSGKKANPADSTLDRAPADKQGDTVSEEKPAPKKSGKGGAIVVGVVVFGLLGFAATRRLA